MYDYLASTYITGSGFSMLTSALLYSAIIALCTVAREAVRAYSRHRDIALLLQLTQDSDSLRYLVELERARHPHPGNNLEPYPPRSQARQVFPR